MRKATAPTILALLLCIALPCIQAQTNKGDDVVIVDDESCGCELYFVNGIQTTERDGLFGFKREDGTVIVEPQYKFVDKFHGDYCLVFHDYGQCGMINRNGKVIVPVQYEEVNYPTEGMIRIRENGLYGFYDTAGNLVIKPQYRTTSGFSEGLAAAIVDIDSITAFYGYIDKNNNLAIKPQFEYAFTFSEGYAVAKKYDRFGLIDRSGKEVFTFKYLELTPMLDGHFFAVDAISEKAALFDERFRQLTPFIYEQITGYSEGFYTVKRDGRQTYLDLKGKERFGFYDYASAFEDGFAIVQRDGKYGIINDRGKTILPIEYDNRGYRANQYVFSDGLALIEKDGRYGFVDQQGRIVIPVTYESAHYCSEGLIPVCKDNRWGYIDKEGNQVCDFYFSDASYFEWGRAEVVYNGNVYKINPRGKCVKSCKTYPKFIKFHFHDKE